MLTLNSFKTFFLTVKTSYKSLVYFVITNLTQVLLRIYCYLRDKRPCGRGCDTASFVDDGRSNYVETQTRNVASTK